MLEAVASGGAVSKPPKAIFKQIPPSEFITASALSTLAGAGSMGTLMTDADNIPWLILKENTQVYAIPQKPLRHSVSYRTMQSASLLYGKNINVAGGVWRIKTFTGLDGNTSEYMRIMNGLLSGGLLANGQQPPIRWANLTYDELGIGNANTSGQGVCTYITETFNQYQYYTRGTKNSLVTLSNQNMDSTFVSNGWRPMLVWQSGAQPWV